MVFDVQSSSNGTHLSDLRLPGEGLGPELHEGAQGLRHHELSHRIQPCSSHHQLLHFWPGENLIDKISGVLNWTRKPLKRVFLEAGISGGRKRRTGGGPGWAILLGQLG